MALQDLARKLAQDPRNRIIKVGWTAGGFVFFRVTMDYVGKQLEVPNGIAKVTGLPWGPFDMFDTDNTKADPSVKIDAPIEDPITVQMFAKYYQWTPKPPIKKTVDKITPGDKFWVIDTATWTGVFNNFFTSFVAQGEREAVRMQMASSLHSANPLLHLTPPDYPEFGVAYVSNTWQELPGPPDPSFFAVPGNSAHEEQNPPTTVTTRKQSALLIINTGKVKKLTSGDPEEFSFNVAANPAAGKKNTLTWMLEAQGIKIEKGGRRTFPVDDDLKPTWKEFPIVKGLLTNPKSDASVDVTVNFKTIVVTMKVNGDGRRTEG